MLLIYQGVEKAYDIFFIHNIISTSYIVLLTFIPLCFYGILSYVALDNINEDIRFVQKYYVLKRAMVFVWTCEWMIIILTYWFNDVPLSQVIIPSAFTGFGILLEGFFIYILHICLKKQKNITSQRRNTMNGVALDISTSEIANNLGIVLAVVATELVEKKGEVDYEEKVIPENTNITLAHDYTVEITQNE
ncbi:hypothetical protein SteCoe_26779 [Stentor coeruleus]|uniref:Uncharacterized protein n=1 Tax=Stentor coeruleus TaxID=5963 RepID=A0A1R2BC29_9CILI|nr:hypothetical protein SteCoe_26779 [Stentor coeruleus]